MVVANIESVLPEGGGWTAAKLVAGAVLTAEGLVLALDLGSGRVQARDRLLARLGRTGRVYRWLLGPVLLAFGFVCLGFGFLELVRTAVDAI